MKTIVELKHDLADRFQARVAELGLTQQAAATACGVQQARISEIRNHRLDQVSADKMLQMLGRLGVIASIAVTVEAKTRDLPRLTA